MTEPEDDPEVLWAEVSRLREEWRTASLRFLHGVQDPIPTLRPHLRQRDRGAALQQLLL
jgi:hypothetical protein